jgi:hypothetical protein
MKFVLSLFAGLMLAACASAPSAEGRILSYVRSNTDGTLPERVLVFQKGEGAVEVYKMVSPCTQAALVTAEFDPLADEAASLVGGRLKPDGTQKAFAWLKRDPETRALSVHMGAPDAAPVQVVKLEDAEAWRLYDFDFADFNARARPPVRGETLAWSMALAWPDAPPESILQSMGVLTATWQGAGHRAGRKAQRYILSGAGFDGGEMWLDARDGTVVEVTAPVPNHPGYTDFRLLLTGRLQGADAWADLLAQHWADCPET